MALTSMADFLGTSAAGDGQAVAGPGQMTSMADFLGDTTVKPGLWERAKAAYAGPSPLDAGAAAAQEAIPKAENEARAAVNMAVSIPGGVGGVFMDAMSRVSDLLHGTPSEEAGRNARMVSEQFNTDWNKLTTALGVPQTGPGSTIEAAVGKFMSATDKGGAGVEKLTGGLVTADTVASVRDAFLNLLGAHAMMKMSLPGEAAAKAASAGGIPATATDMSSFAALTPEAVVKGVEAVKPVAPPIAPALTADISDPSLSLPKAPTKADIKANKAAIDSIVVDPAKLKEIFDRASVENTDTQLVKNLFDRVLKPEEAPKTEVSTAAELPKIQLGEPIPELNSAMDKLIKGEDLTVGETSSVKRLAVDKDANIVGPNGQSFFQKGQVDPSLLKVLGIMGFGAVAAKGIYDWYNSPNVSTDSSSDQYSTLAAGLVGATILHKTGKFEGVPEADLIDTYRVGGPEGQAAFAKIYADTNKQLIRSIQQMGKDPAAAEDIAQRVYEKAARVMALPPEAPGAFRGDAQISTYLHSVAKNEVKNAWRSESVRPQTTSLTEDPVTGATSAPESHMMEQNPDMYKSAQDVASQNVLAQRMSAAMDKLPDNYRNIFDAVELQGMSYDEAAAHLSVPVGTIRSGLSRAKEQLQGSLRDYRDLQAGKADPRTLAAIAVVGGGAALGAYMNPDSPFKSALYGAGVGMLLMNAHPASWIEAIKRAQNSAPLIRIDDLIADTAYGKKVMERATFQMTSDITSRVPELARRQAIYDALDGEKVVLTSDETKVMSEIRDFYDKVGGMAKDAKVIKNLLQDYATRIYGKAAKDFFASKTVGGYDVQTSSPFGKNRAFATRAEAAAAGYIPVTTDIAKVLELYSDSVSSAIYNKKFVDNLRQTRLGDGTKLVTKQAGAPADYVVIDHPQLQGMAVHPDIAPDLKALFDRKSMGAIAGTLDAINSTQKRLGVSLSLFHVMALEHAMIGATSILKSPLRGIKAFGQSFAPAIFGESLAVKMIREGGLGDAVDSAMKDGVQFSFESRKPVMEEEQLGVYKGLDIATKFMDNTIPGSGKYTIGAVTELNHMFDRAMWGRFHTTIKLETYMDKIAELAKNNADLVNAGKAVLKSRDEIGQASASFVNDLYGGLNYQKIIGEFSTRWGKELASAAFSPSGRLGMRMLMFAPDWTISTTRAFTKAFGPKALTALGGAVLGSQLDTSSTESKVVGGAFGALAGLGVGAALGLKGTGPVRSVGEQLKGLVKPTELQDLHRQYILRSAFIYTSLVDAWNYNNTGHHIWENKDPTRLERADGTTQMVSKHFMEPFHLLINPRQQALGKASFLVKETLNQTFDSEYLSTHSAPRMGGVPKGQDIPLPTRLEHAAKQFLPITAQGFGNAEPNPTKILANVGGMPIYGKSYDERAATKQAVKDLHQTSEYKQIQADRKSAKLQGVRP